MNEKIFEFLQSLADNLGTTVERLWAISVRQATIDSIITSCVLGILIIGYIAFYKYYLLNDNIIPEKDLKITRIITAVTLVFIIIILTPSLITGFVNPEYKAIKDILNQLK